MLDLIIFDCDGTLVDSEYLNNLATIQILHEEGLKQFDIEYAFAHFVGLRLKNILEDIQNATGHKFPANIGPRYVKRVEELTPEYLKPLQGAEELVAEAAKRGKICVASNGQRDNVLFSLEFTGLKKFFPDDHVFTATQVANGKPAPDVFLFAAKNMNAEPSQCLVIEDSIPGITGAKAAGMRVLGINHQGEDYAERMKKAGAETVFGSLIHIRNHLFS